MNGNSRIPYLNPEDVFEEAVGRLEQGESIESIVASYPHEDAADLADELHIVQLALDIQHEPIPQPSVSDRMAAKQGFLAAAAAMKLKQEAVQAVQPVRAAEPTRRVAPVPAPQPSFADRIVSALRATFSVRTLRLAPAILALAVVLLSASTFVTMAQSSVPGDATYSFKQWMRKQELQFTAPDRRDLVRQAQEQELAEDVRKAAARADQNSAVIQAEDTQVFYGKNGRLLKIGGLTVMDRYQPDANVEVFRPMDVEGDLEPGSTVGLVYQIMPGQSDTVQGISLVVVAPPAETPAPAELPAVDVQPRDEACTVTRPDGWIQYQVQPGDNLSYIARRGEVSVTEIVEANCLANETIIIGASLYVPEEAVLDHSSILTCSDDVPEGWAEYEVQVGDNLTRLAESRGTTVEDVMRANCLDTDTILIGSRLLLPAE
ncbi:MAG: LysM peptidoglycan-binding domain-containing protein [Caldilineaceae bacterium]|jgi:LysM repeat protein